MLKYLLLGVGASVLFFECNFLGVMAVGSDEPSGVRIEPSVQTWLVDCLKSGYQGSRNRRDSQTRHG